MSREELQLVLERLDAPHVSVASHAKTWARLEIHLGDVCVTRVIDARTRDVRDGVRGPIMPLAEWLVSSWWYLHHESPRTFPLVGARKAHAHQRPWFSRHNLLFAREGSPLPDLTIARANPSELIIKVVPDPRSIGRYPVMFTSDCERFVRREVVTEQLRGLVETALEWLRDCKQTDADELRESWEAIRNLTGDDRLLRARAAALGLDGDDTDAVSDALANQLVHSSHEWPSEVVEDLLETGPGASLSQRYAWIEAARETAQEMASPSVELSKPRAVVANTRAKNTNAPVYNLGWELARQVRSEVLGLGARAHGAEVDAAVAKWISTADQGGTPGALRGWVGANGRFVAVLRPETSAPTRRWLVARAMCLAFLGGKERLVTNAQSWSQSVGRAFATELTAPLDLLRTRVDEDQVLDEDELYALAAEIGAPARAVQHQLENHNLAVVE